MNRRLLGALAVAVIVLFGLGIIAGGAPLRFGHDSFSLRV